VEIDRYAVALAHELQKSVLEDYDGYEFHPAAAKLQNFCSEELSAFYLDVLKDRLYTCGKDSPARRSAQNALYHVTHSLLRLIAPVLSFTAEEAWRVFQPGDDTVFAHTTIGSRRFPGRMPAREMAGTAPDPFGGAETPRESPRRGKNRLFAASRSRDRRERREAGIAERPGDDLRFVLITSRATVVRAAGGADEAIRTLPSPHPKCQRCWHWRADVGADPNHPGICGRCVQNLYGSGEPRRFA